MHCLCRHTSAPHDCCGRAARVRHLLQLSQFAINCTPSHCQTHQRPSPFQPHVRHNQLLTHRCATWLLWQNCTAQISCLKKKLASSSSMHSPPRDSRVSRRLVTYATMLPPAAAAIMTCGSSTSSTAQDKGRVQQDISSTAGNSQPEFEAILQACAPPLALQLLQHNETSTNPRVISKGTRCEHSDVGCHQATAAFAPT